ncbi:GAF and ANTAR domain-containing protein [Umezawaea sp. Da 62-37]|uniref:GAF and ANTAR domain-containing protein n=1 Tax=Umezawaea sp. Da 62-37 TaxID=3075927 RepID=UPI0028F74682|nr:GAF and ANTAR domain-containing protein [Umezawaea sp. Da 62-37]WNV83947.1 GAF and ANTAR domain-containing protein [Umezawaea sp. Da 62-37]
MSDEVEWQQDKSRFVDTALEAVEQHPVLGLSSPLARQFAQLTRSLLDAPSVGDVLNRVVFAALEAIPDASVVSVTLRAPDGSFHTPVQTDPLANEIDQVQYATGEGPCVHAARMPGPGLAESGDLANDPNWPLFGPASAARGMNSLLSTTLLPDAHPPQLSGALNVYSAKTGAFTAADRDTALLLATHGSLALAATRAVTAADLKLEHLRKAIDSRDVIGQAKGILMHRRGITADEAFDTLRTTSQRLNVKLAELARTFATRHREIDRLL